MQLLLPRRLRSTQKPIVPTCDPDAPRNSPQQGTSDPNATDQFILHQYRFLPKIPSAKNTWRSRLVDKTVHRFLGAFRVPIEHGKQGFVILTKSFVKIGITKTFCYNNKSFSPLNKTFGCCSKIFGCSNKYFICCP